MGKAGLIGTLLAALALCAAAFAIGTGIPQEGAAGICLPAPENWGIPLLGAWGLNTALIFIAGASLYFLNKSYSFVRGAEATLPLLYIFMTAANPWVSAGLTSSTLMATVLIICMAVMFGCYRRRNATQEFFVIATLLSLGSMVQYGFLLLAPWAIISGILLKCFRFKESLAFLLGLAAPYWVALGLGLVSPEDFSLPSLDNAFWNSWPKKELFAGILLLAVTALAATVLALDNVVRLYAGNTQRRLYNVSILILGISLIICMGLDFSNLPAYIASLYIFAAIQVPSFYTIRNVRGQALWTAIVMLFFLAGFILLETGLLA